MAEMNVWEKELHNRYQQLAEALGFSTTCQNPVDWESLIYAVKLRDPLRTGPQEPPEVIARRVEEGHRWDEELRFKCLETAWHVGSGATLVGDTETRVKKLLDAASEIYAFVRGAPPPGLPTAIGKAVIHTVGED